MELLEYKAADRRYKAALGKNFIEKAASAALAKTQKEPQIIRALQEQVYKLEERLTEKDMRRETQMEDKRMIAQVLTDAVAFKEAKYA